MKAPQIFMASQVVLVKKEPACQCRRCKRCGFPGLGKSPGGRHGNPLQYSYLENPMDRGVWQATVQGVAKNWTGLSN